MHDDLEGQALADALYADWKQSTERIEIPEFYRVNLPDEWLEATELDPELAAHLYQDDFLGPVLKHPLVFAVPYHVFENPRLNYGLHWKRECLEKYRAGRDGDQFIYAHERPYRVDALQKIIDEWEPTGHEVWNCARTAWMDSENIYQNEWEWRTIFEDWLHDGQVSFMTSDDVIEWAMLPDDEPIPVYRGFCVEGREEGFSWTTDKIRAKFFAKRFADYSENPQGVRGKAKLAIGRVMKSDVIGYLNGRSESEVVVFPENVDIARVATLTIKVKS